MYLSPFRLEGYLTNKGNRAVSNFCRSRTNQIILAEYMVNKDTKSWSVNTLGLLVNTVQVWVMISSFIAYKGRIYMLMQ